VPPTAVPEVVPTRDVREKPNADLDPGYLVIGWDDPVNLMDYVTHVLQKVFGWSREKAEKHMLEIHTKGKSLLARETFEQAEHHVHQLQQFGLHATMERGE
jgi:ATP-dependent Clp protease adaptor protein ClpS